MKNIFLISLLILITASCKKNGIILSSEKSITSFMIKAAVNTSAISSDIYGVIEKDTIRLHMPQNVPLNALVPTISFTGQTLSPQSGVAQNFSTPLNYTVTAADGSTKKYTAVVTVLSSTKNILSFQFRTADNPGKITSDINGIIVNDTVRFIVPYGNDVSGVKPFVTHNGKRLNPGLGEVQDFSRPVIYTVTAEDGSTKNYTVITQSNLSIYFGSTDKYIYAIDAGTGDLQWKYFTGGAVNSSPALENGVLFIGSDDGYLYALNTSSGSLKWKTKIGNAVSTSPFVANGVVYVTCTYTFGNTLYLVYALNAATGSILWNKPLGSLIDASPVVDDNRLFVGDNGYGMYALSTVDGSLLWRYPSGITKGGAAVINGNVYVTGETVKFLRFDASSGNLLSRYFEGNVINVGSYSSPTLYNGNIFLTAYWENNANYFYAIDSASMTVKWKSALVRASAPVAEYGMVYVSFQDNGGLGALDANTGTVKWRYIPTPLTRVSMLNPTVSNGIVYCGSSDKKMYAFDALTGAVKWTYLTDGVINSGPCVIDAHSTVAYPGVSGHHQ